MSIDLDLVTQRSLRAIQLTRTAGLHHYGHLLGISLIEGPEGSTTLAMAPEAGGGDGPVAPAALATLADLALGAAIHEHVGPGARLATTTLELQHLGGGAHGPLTVAATVSWSRLDESGGDAVAECRIRDGSGAPVATGIGAFVSLPSPAGVRPFRWESVTDSAGSADPSSLSDEENRVFGLTLEAARRADLLGTTLIDELLAIRWDGTGHDGVARGLLSSGPHIANRVGHIQGGAVYGAAVSCANQLIDPEVHELADAHVQFLRPTVGEAIELEARIVKGGRRAAFLSCSIGSDGMPMATAQLTYRSRSGPA